MTAALVPGWPLLGVDVDFSRTPALSQAAAVWRGLTDRVESLSCSAGRQYELGQVETGMATVVVRNADEALTPANPGSPYNAGGQVVTSFRPLRVWAMCGPDGAGGITTAGNILNDTNTAEWGLSGNLGSFEAGLGSWSGLGSPAPTVASSTVRAHDGTHSMLVTWPTGPGGKATLAASHPASYTLGATWPLRDGQQYTVSAWVWVASGPAVIININNQDSAPSTTTGAWQRISLTFTADASYDRRIFLYPNGATTSGQQVWVDSVQVEYGPAATTWSSTGPTIYPIHTGFTEKFPETWRQNGYAGYMALTSVDALGVLQRIGLTDVMTTDAGQDGPVVAYPLWEPAGSNEAYSHGTSPVAAPMRVAHWGSLAGLTTGQTAATLVFGDSQNPGPDGSIASFTCARFTPGSLGDCTYLNATLGPQLVIQPPTGATGEFWYRTGSSSVGVNGLVAFINNAGSLEVKTATGGGLTVTYTGNAGGSYDYNVTTSGTWTDQAWHHVVVTEAASGGTVTMTLYVDGVAQATGTRSGPNPFTTSDILAGSSYWPNFGNPFNGWLARVSVYATALTPTRVASHYASATGFASDKAGARIRRVIGWVGWQGGTSVPDGAATCGPLKMDAGTKANNPILISAVTENGLFYVAPGGQLTFLTRGSYYLQTAARWTLGEAEAPYQAVGLDTDPQYLYNKITVTADGLPAQVVMDATSVADYWEFDGQVSTIHDTTGQAVALGQNLLTRFSTPRQRVSTVTLNAGANPGLWLTVLGLRVGDRVRLLRRTPAVTYTVDGYVERVAHAGDMGRGWVTTLSISPAYPYPPWILGDPVYGVIGTTNVVVY